MSGLRAAAAALIEEAPEAMVLDIVRLLVNSLALPATSRTDDPEWDALRRALRQAMAARGVDYGGVAQTIGGSATALRIALTSRKPPRPAVQSRLRAWLEEVPAARPIPFRGACGNGAAAA